MNKFIENYTERTRRIAFKFPTLSFIVTQVNFWIFAFLFIAVLFHFFTLAIKDLYPNIHTVHFGFSLNIAIVGGIVYGLCTGLIDLFTNQGVFTKYFTGLRVLLKALLYFLAFVVLFLIMSLFWNQYLMEFIWKTEDIEFSQAFNRHMSAVLFIYTLVLNFVLSYVKQVNNKFGPGILIPLLLGKYQTPSVEKRIFLFMDLKSSTAYAEKLGHLKYSEMIKDCFLLANKILVAHNAEIYQYVGDEVVITWREDAGLYKARCVNYYFDFMDSLNGKKEYYYEKYGLVPMFKAGIHLGEVTAIEVGEIKKEIAYHGDTINTASRIQGVCNKYERNLVVSQKVVARLGANEHFIFSPIGSELFKGKTKTVQLFCIEKNHQVKQPANNGIPQTTVNT